MGTDKALLPWQGRPLIIHIHDALRAECAEVIVATGAASRYTSLGIAGVDDVPGVQGPMAGLIAALRRATQDICLVRACDMPEVDAALIDRLFGALGANRDAAVAESGGMLQPLCGVYRRAPALAAFEAQAATGRYALHRALARMNVASVVAPAVLHNLNTPDDLASVQER